MASEVALKLNIVTSEIIKQVEELQVIIQHYKSIGILIQGIQDYVPEPHQSIILKAWDDNRNLKEHNE